MVGLDDVVITGLGCVSPIGIGREAFQENLFSKTSAITKLHQLSDDRRTAIFGAAIKDFNGKQYVTPRKAIKVMSREVQLAYSAAHLAWRDAALEQVDLEPDRIGVVYGSEIIPGEIGDLIGATQSCVEGGVLDQSKWGRRFGREIFPLWMLKNLPNMPACHVGIAVDARGPNNSIAQDEVGGLLAVGEAASIIARGQADVMIAGGVSSRVSPTRLIYRNAELYDQPEEEDSHDRPRCVPFDLRRRGIVPSEGSAALVLERRSHAVKRGASIFGKVCGSASRCAVPEKPYGGSRVSIASAAEAALTVGQTDPSELSHVCAQGYSHQQLDVEEAEAISQVVPDVSVTAFSSYFGTAGSACGVLELCASLLAVGEGKTLPTLGYEQKDVRCDIRVSTTEQMTEKSRFLKLSFTPQGQAAAVVIQCAT